jgi:hypothetical protein
MRQISSTSILSYANKFIRRAQSFSSSEDPMKKELDATVRKGIESILIQFLNTKPISWVEVFINYNIPFQRVIFQTTTNNHNEEVEKELNTALAKFVPKTTSIVAKYQKDKPLNNYKYLSMEV